MFFSRVAMNASGLKPSVKSVVQPASHARRLGDRSEHRRGHHDSRDAEDRIPNHRREEVVEEAVRRERILACKPEVVPDIDAALHERSPIHVRGEIATAWQREDEESRHRRRDRSAQNDLSGLGRCRWASTHLRLEIERGAHVARR